MRWSEAESEAFLRLGELFTPWRSQIAAVVADLVPADRDEAFVAVDVGSGDGWLSEAVLRRYPRARVIALDGSPAMREAARRRLAPFGARAEVRAFELDAEGWALDLRAPVRCFVSCLAVHHLDDEGKRRLFRAMRSCLEPGGGVLVADLVRPASPQGWRHAARAWQRDVRDRARRLGAGEQARHLLEGDWNWFEHPDDPMDRPARLVDHLRWLQEAGFEGVDVFWVRAGHAVFGGYAPAG